MKSMIQKYSEVIGPSGYETQIRSMIRDDIKNLVDEIEVDNLGNLIARKGQRSEGGKRIMLHAHMDEVALIVTHIDQRGFARFTQVGSIQAQALIGSRMKFTNGIQGLVGLETSKNPEKNPTIDQMFIDTGASSDKDCPVRIGDIAVFDGEFIDFGRRVAGKALDGRVGVCILIEILKRFKSGEVRSAHELFFVFSAQELVGGRGAPAAAYRIEPEIGIMVGLMPGEEILKATRGNCELGKGPAIKIRDASALSDPRVVAWITQTSEECGTAYQAEIIKRVFGEKDSVQMTRMGVAIGGLSVPARYLHSGAEMVDLGDVEKTVDLLGALLGKSIEI